MTVRTIDEIFRDFVTDGIPASGPFNPRKPDIRDTLKALTEGGENFPDNRVIRLNNANEGTANNIVVTASVAIPAAAYQVLYILNVTQANTGPVIVSGAISRSLVTNTNQQLAAGYITPGMAVLCIDTGTELRLLSYGDAEVVATAAEASADRAEAAAEAAESAVGGALSNFDTRSLVAATNILSLVSYVRTAGYATAGDGGGALYKRVATEPSHIGKIQSADGAWWEIAEREFDVRMFGAKGDGIADDTAAIQGAINALPARGGRINVPGGRYKLTSAINVGNGNGGTTQSSKNAIKIICGGGGFAVSGSLVPTIFTYTGPLNTGPMFNFRGRLSDCDFKNAFLQCNGLIGGVNILASSAMTVDLIKIVSPAPNSVGFRVVGGGAPTGNYNISNQFSRISVALTEPNSIGFYMDGDYSVQNDTWLSKFELCRADMVVGATNAVGWWFKFVDSCTFIRCHSARYEPTGTGAIFDARANNTFPSGMHFMDCSISNIVVYEDASNKIRKNYFTNHGTYDNEILPGHAMLVGTTDTGLHFGPIGYATGTGGAVTQTTDKSTAVTLNKVCGQITMMNSPLAANTSVSFVMNNSFIATTDTIVVNITGGGAYGAYMLTVSDVQSGLAVITLRNVSAGSLSESVVLGFAIIKAVSS